MAGTTVSKEAFRNSLPERHSPFSSMYYVCVNIMVDGCADAVFRWKSNPQAAERFTVPWGGCRSLPSQRPASATMSELI